MSKQKNNAKLKNILSGKSSAEILQFNAQKAMIARRIGDDKTVFTLMSENLEILLENQKSAQLVKNCRTTDPASIKRVIEQTNINIGKTYLYLADSQFHYDAKKTLKYLELSYQYLQSETIIFKQWQCNFNYHKFQESIVCAQKLTNKMKDLLIIRSKLMAGEILPREALSAVEQFSSLPKSSEQEHWYIHTMVRVQEKSGNYDNAISLIQESQKFLTKEAVAELYVLVNKVIIYYCMQGKYHEGRIYLKSMYEKHPSLKFCKKNPLDQYYEFLLHENQGDHDLADILLASLTENSTHSYVNKMLSDNANQVRFYIEIEKKNFENAKIYLARTSLNKDFCLEIIEYLKKYSIAQELSEKILEEELADDDLATAVIESKFNEQEQELSEGISYEVLKPEITGPSKNEQILEEQRQIEYWQNPRAIHNFIQRQKAQLARKKLDKLEEDNNESSSSWILPNNKEYNSNSIEKNVYKLKGRDNYYVTIDPTLCSAQQIKTFTKTAVEKV